MKFIPAVIAAALAFIIGSSAFAADRYICKKNIFGCLTVYAGDANADDVAAYLNQTKALVASVLEDSTRIQTVAYELDTGKVALTARPGKFVGPGEPGIIYRKFVEARIYVTEVTIVSGPLRRIKARYTSPLDKGGRTRYFALKDTPISRADHFAKRTVLFD